MSNEPKVGYRTVHGLQIRYADSDGSASQHLMLNNPYVLVKALYRFMNRETHV